MSMIFISHDLAVVRSIADRIVVLEQGEVRELGRAKDVFEEPASDYTRSLMQAQRDWSLETPSVPPSPDLTSQSLSL